MQSLFSFLFAAQLLALAYSQAPVDPKATAPTPAPAPVSFLKFDPPLAYINQDSTDGVYVAASLSKKPKGSVSIYLEAPNLTFSKCKLSFTTTNWNKQQLIKVSPVPYLTEAAADREIKAKFCYCGKKDKDLHKSCQEYQVTRNKASGSICYADGDPHYTSLGGVKYDFMGHGAFYVVKSDPLTIQQFNTPWGSVGNTAQTKVALRYFNTVYVFDTFTRRAQLASATSEGVQITEVPGASWRITLSDETSVVIPYYGTGSIASLGTYVTLGQRYKGKITGLCGDLGSASLTMAGGKAAPEPNSFGNSWRVAEDDNLFSLGVKASSVIKANSVSMKRILKNKCTIPDLDDGKGDGKAATLQGEVVVSSFGTFKPQENKELLAKVMAEPKAVDPKAPTQEWADTAKAKCTALLTIPDVNAVLAPAKFIADCVSDCILTKSYDLIESAKRQYLFIAREYIKSTKAEPAFKGDTPAAQNLNDVVVKACSAAGLGSDTACPNKCSGKGRCTYMGCICKDGYTGIDCSQKIPNSPSEEKAYTDKPAKPLVKFVDTPKASINDAVNKAYQEEAAKKKKNKNKNKNKKADE